MPVQWGYIYIMKKLANVFFLLISLATVGVLAAAWVEEGFSLVQEVPKPLKPGQEATVKVTIKPGNIKGFVKLQLELPKGFSAKAVETNGGVFSLLNGSISLVWMEFPSTPSFNIMYKLQVPATATGNETIEGRLAFLLKGEKRMLTLDPTLLEIVPDVAVEVDSAPEQTPKDSKPTAPEPQPIAASTPAPELAKAPEAIVPAQSAPAESQTPPQPTPAPSSDPSSEAKKESKDEKKEKGSNDASALIKVHREITPINQNELTVKVVVENLAGLKSFAKFEEIIPMGFKAKAVQTKGAAFTFMKNQVRILWNQMPVEETFFAAYKIIRDGSTDKTLDLEADFYFLVEGEAEVIHVEDRQIRFGDAPPTQAPPSATAAQPASEKKASSTIKSNTSGTANTAGNTKVKNQTKTATAISKTSKELVPPVSDATQSRKDSTPNAASVAPGVKREEASDNNPLQPTVSAGSAQLQYRVQVCALRSPGAAEDVAKFLSLNETLTQEMHEGWHKYTIGNFTTYPQAKGRRNELGALPTGPFVAAYNQGTRITVQEALMISGQKWVK
jgi:hypothetical protein